jgi:hypothetical protein
LYTAVTPEPQASTPRKERTKRLIRTGKLSTSDPIDGPSRFRIDVIKPSREIIVEGPSEISTD